MCSLLRLLITFTLSRGSADISSDARYLVAYNFHNGFDLFDLTTRKCLRTYTAEVGTNAPLPAIFVHSNADILLGSAVGEAQVVNLSFDVTHFLRRQSTCQSSPVVSQTSQRFRYS